MNELIFIYNANSGVVNSLIDWAHKIISPDTYKCSLCSITYNNSDKKNEWSKLLPSSIAASVEENFEVDMKALKYIR